MKWTYYCLLVGYWAILFLAMLSEHKQEKVKQVVIYKEPTDEQLLNWWFGTGDKAALRERICK
jgi:hypothetical protein